PPVRVRELAGHTGRISAVAFRPDGRQLASASTGSEDGKTPGEVYLWDADTGERVGQLRGLKASALSLAWRPGGRSRAALSAQGDAQVWEAASGQQVRALRPAAEFGPTYLAVGTVTFSHDGTRLAAAVANALDTRQRAEIVIFDADTGTEL